MQPWGDDRADYRIALLATALETLARDEPVWMLSDFLPFVIDFIDFEEGDPAGQTAEVQAELWRALAARHQ